MIMKPKMASSAQSPQKLIRVSIVEDDNRVRDSLARLIDRSPGFACVSRHPSAEDALRDLPPHHPNIVLMDINLGGMSGIECVRLLKEALPETQVMMLTVYENTDHIFSALSAGASGYLLKQTPPDELLAAIQELNRGGSPMSSHIARKVVGSFQSPVPATASRETASLSPREKEVLDHLAKGFLYKEIAEALGIGYDTVHTHIRRVYEKLHVRSRAQAVAKHLGQSEPRGTPAAGVR
jgi:DNA-binding NarL/FixJ family response regulator